MGAERDRKEGRGPRKEGRDIRHYTHKRKINRTGDTGGRGGGSQSWMSRRFHAKGEAKRFARLAPEQKQIGYTPSQGPAPGPAPLQPLVCGADQPETPPILHPLQDHLRALPKLLISSAADSKEVCKDWETEACKLLV